jgi:hypothetical protein
LEEVVDDLELPYRSFDGEAPQAQSTIPGYPASPKEVVELKAPTIDHSSH